MKKTFGLFLIIFLVSVLGVFSIGLKSVSASAPVITVSNIQTIFATITVTGLTPNNNAGYKLSVKRNDGTEAWGYTLYGDDNTDNGRPLLASPFTPSTVYTVSLTDNSNNSIVAHTSFSTLASKKLVVTDIRSQFATITATGLTTNNGAGYYLSTKRNNGTEDYHMTIYAETDNGNPLLASPLIPSTAYTVSLTNNATNNIVANTSFSTLASNGGGSVTLTTPDLFPDGVTLKATELEPNKSVTFTLRNNINYPLTHTYLKTKDEISDSTGTTSAGFLELSPGGQYVATINYVGENLTLFTLPFSTPATGLDMTVIMKDLTQTSVAFVLAGFPHNKEISFNVENYDSSTPSYSDPQDYMTDDSGTALFQFYGLSPGGHYKYTHSEVSGSGSFWTKAADPNPNPNPDPNPNPTKTGTPGVLVPCSDNCGFKDLLDMVNTVINFILVFMAVPIAAIMFAYAGFLLVFSGGEPAKRTKAKDIFINVAIGLVIIAACWIIVHTILSIVGFDGSWIGL